MEADGDLSHLQRGVAITDVVAFEKCQIVRIMSVYIHILYTNICR